MSCTVADEKKKQTRKIIGNNKKKMSYEAVDTSDPDRDRDRDAERERDRDRDREAPPP